MSSKRTWERRILAGLIATIDERGVEIIDNLEVQGAPEGASMESAGAADASRTVFAHETLSPVEADRVEAALGTIRSRLQKMYDQRDDGPQPVDADADGEADVDVDGDGEEPVAQEASVEEPYTPPVAVPASVEPAPAPLEVPLPEVATEDDASLHQPMYSAPVAASTVARPAGVPELPTEGVLAEPPLPGAIQ